MQKQNSKGSRFRDQLTSKWLSSYGEKMQQIEEDGKRELFKMAVGACPSESVTAGSIPGGGPQSIRDLPLVKSPYILS